MPVTSLSRTLPRSRCTELMYGAQRQSHHVAVACTVCIMKTARRTVMSGELFGPRYADRIVICVASGLESNHTVFVFTEASVAVAVR